MTSMRDFAVSVHIGLRLMMILSLFLILPGSISAPLAMQQLQVILNSSIPNGSRVCSGQQIEIQCITTGSLIQEWASDNYIGLTTGDLVQIIYNETEIGEVLYTGNVNLSVSIELLSSEIEGMRLVSILRMTASNTHPNITASCYNPADYTLNGSTYTFTVIDDPDNYIVRDVDVFQVAQTPVAAGPCMLVVTWSPLTFTTEPSDYFFSLTVNSVSLRMNSTAGRAVFNISECGNQSVKIYAGNSYCDRSGPTVSRVVTDITPVINIANDIIHFPTIEPIAISTFKVAMASYSSMVLPMLLTFVMLSVC